MRPIVAWEDDSWLFALNANLGMPLTAPDSHQGPELEPCAMTKLKLRDIALGLEYYASLGPVRGMLPLSEQEHYVFQTIDVLGWRGVELDVGVGEGLTEASNRVVLKTVIGYAFGR